jgi:hypothetical protein
LTLDLNLKATTKGLEAWSDKKVGHVDSQLGLAQEILHQLKIAQDSRPRTPPEVVLKNMLKKQSLALASFRRTIARSRSRIGWLREGDANTRFFQMQARHLKRKNIINRSVSDNWICTSQEAKAKLINEFCDSLLGTNWNKEHSIDLHAVGGEPEALG